MTRRILTLSPFVGIAASIALIVIATHMLLAQMAAVPA